ncbi:MAG: hypothetical protein ACYC4P_20605, partial [Thermoanaerobaculia bacterium]
HRATSFAISRRFASRLPTVTSGPPSFRRLGHREKDGVHRTLTRAVQRPAAQNCFGPRRLK